MACAKSSSLPNLPSVLELSDVDKWGLLADIMPEEDDGLEEVTELEKEITEYACALNTSPLMRRYFQKVIDKIIHTHGPDEIEDRKAILAFFIAELHFAKRMQVVC